MHTAVQCLTAFSALQSMAASRDGLYTAGYLGVCPALQEQLQKLTVFEKAPPAVTFVIAGITAGISAAIVTHPADTIKTRMQVRSC